jgi:hypothetical protein
LDEVTVARECDYARIKYKEREIAATVPKIGPEIREVVNRGSLNATINNH